MESKSPDDTLRMRWVILICAFLRMFEGTFSLDSAHIYKWADEKFYQFSISHTVDKLGAMSGNKDKK